ncbi:MAG: EF-P beta-lysylation protein EpmB [Planctomycetaceae bacterium]|nr:EF-P beta-lysylation protein EpmB [Planctomycetaceae bacterium]
MSADRDSTVAGGPRPVAGESQPVVRWQHALKTAVRDAATLCRLLELPPAWADSAGAETTLADDSLPAGTTNPTGNAFPVFAPLAYVARMRPGDPSDPLLRQVLPLRAERDPTPGYSTDPVGDLAAQREAGLLQKYSGRALMVTTGACAVHCRYCFRRHFPYSDAPKSLADWQPALDRVAADASIREIILSGGDPLTLPDGQLGELVGRIAAIPHVQRLRIHTRLPIVIPQRVTPELLGWLRGTRLTPIMVVHANHAQELDPATAFALSQLVDAGVPVLNQAVLLRGVNDTVEALAALCEQLVDLRVMPYYLHQLDRVAGAAHFEVPETEGLRLIEQLRSRLPGYAVPRYVREVEGETSKLPVSGGQ